MSSTKISRVLDAIAGPFLGAGALVLYLLTLSHGPFPGRSASLIVQYSGLLPRLSPAHSLWVAATTLVNMLPIGTLSQRMNVFSAVCGALCVWLVHDLVRAGILLGARVTPGSESRTRLIARIAGVTAAVTFMFSTPFWYASNRADTMTLDMLLLLIAVRLLLAAVARPVGLFPLVLAFFCGMAIVEFATIALFVPVFAVLVIMAMLTAEEFSLRRLAMMGAAFAAGLLLYFVAAGVFYGSDGYELRGYNGYWHVVRIMLRDQYQYLTRSLPRVGWLLVLLTTVVPWIAGTVVARRGLNGREDWSFVALHVVMTGLAMTVVMSLPIAPWPMLGARNLLVTPYLLVSTLAGYLVAYWLLFPWNFWVDAEEPWRQKMRLWLGPVLALPLAACVAIAPFRNAAETDTAEAVAVNEFARQVVNLCEEGNTIITGGDLDDHVLIAARELKRNVRVINQESEDNDIYRRFMYRMFSDPEIRALVDVGVRPALARWLRKDPGAAAGVVTLGGVELWTQAGFVPVPDRLLFRGRHSLDGLDPEKLMAVHRDFWAGQEAGRQGLSAKRRSIRRQMDRRVATVANELGVLLEDLGRPELAFEAYCNARNFDALNISALFNLLSLMERGFQSPLKEQLVKELGALCSDPRVAQRFDWLVERSGRTRSSRVLGESGWSQVGKGALRSGIRDMENAAKMAPPALRPLLIRRLADSYLAAGDPVRAREFYAEIKAGAPGDPYPDLGLARAAVLEKDFGSVAGLLGSARAKGALEPDILLIEAELLEARGDVPGARASLERLLALSPQNWPAWGRFLDIIIGQSDVEALSDAVKQLSKLEKPDIYLTEVARGYLALAAGDRRSARNHFALASDARPAQVAVLETLLRLELEEGTAERALRYAQSLLKADPSNAFGYYVIGTRQVEQRRYAEAEVSLRRSIEAHKTPEALNNLAWIMQEQGRLAEAESLAMEGLRMQQDSPNLWDTLGVTLKRAGRTADALAPLRRAVDLAANDPDPLIHLAELELESGNGAKAVELCDAALRITPKADGKRRTTIREVRRSAVNQGGGGTGRKP